MNKTQLQSFLVAAQTLSFTKAADRLFLTQQAVSRNIINLENELGVTLFARDVRRLRLTPEGEYYYSYFINVKKDFQSITDEINNLYIHLAKRLRIGFSMWIDPLGRINEGIELFRKKHPEVGISGRQYHNDKLFEELSSGNLDVLLMSEAQITWIHNFEKAAIAYEDICLYAPSYVEGDKPDKNLWGLPILLNSSWEWSYFEWRQIMFKEMESLNLQSNRIYSLPNMQSLFAELAIGDCVTLCDNNFGHAARYKNMRRFHIDFSSKVVCLWNNSNENSLIEDFISDMREAFGYRE
ncbi:MAG: LysR family transcriptional regulator [Oscillospiraceae bacterium]|jgi:DNA-binding transcriptional LysR family regulator